MLNDLKLDEQAVLSIISNAELSDDGTYPDWNQTHCWELRSNATTKWLMSGAGFHSHWFQRGPLNAGYLKAPRLVLGCNDKTAKKFGILWFGSKRDEADALWKKRNTLKHFKQARGELSLRELQIELRHLVMVRRNKEWPTPSNCEFVRCRRKEIVEYIEKYKADETAEANKQTRIFQFFQPTAIQQQQSVAFESAEISNDKSREVARRQALESRKRRVAEQDAVYATPLISTIFDVANCKDNNYVEEDQVEGEELRVMLAQDLINEAEFDEEALEQLEVQTRNLILGHSQDWEI